MRWTGCGPGSCANSNHCDWQGKEPTFTATNAFRHAGRAPPATSPRTRLLQISKCATHQDPTDSLLNSARQGGLQRPMTPGGATAAGNPHGTVGALAQGTRLQARTRTLTKSLSIRAAARAAKPLGRASKRDRSEE